MPDARSRRRPGDLDSGYGMAMNATTRFGPAGGGREIWGDTIAVKRALLFPGQGSQALGMGKSLADSFAAARRLYEEVDDALGQRLSGLMFDGPECDLTLTENAQPALLAASLAVVRVLQAESGFVLSRHVAYVTGHSLGEYSALAAAGALAVGTAARLLRLRGQAMQRAVPPGRGAMAALIGLDVDTARRVAAEALCAVANDNAPGQVVVSGHRDAVERAIEIARAYGGRRSIVLPVSAPFHSPLMAPAAAAMREALEEVELRPPLVPLVANVSAQPVSDPVAIKQLLVEQVTAMVRWREIMLFLAADGVEEIVETGTGHVLAGLARRILPELRARSAGTAAEVDALLHQF
jgi:[acyl-carrier-protein] S-malonyltransferase